MCNFEGDKIMAYKDQVVAEFNICRSQTEKKNRNLRAALTAVAAGGFVALGSTFDPNETSQFVNILQNLGLASTSISAISGAILTGISHSKYSEYLRLENNYDALTSSINELKVLSRKRNKTEEVKEDIKYYKELRDESFENLVNHFTKKYDIASVVSKYAKIGAGLAAATGTALPLASSMKPLEAIATAATGILVAGICGFTASNYKGMAQTNATALKSLYNIFEDGLQPKPEFPGVEYWEII
jgi:hypothetical protein